MTGSTVLYMLPTMKYILLVAVLYCIHGGEANAPPIITALPTYPMFENTTNGTFLFDISASYDKVWPVFEIKSDEVSHIVRLENIRNGSGVTNASVVLNNMVDRETDGATKTLTFYASDDVYTVSKGVILIIMDVNDEKPVFTQAGYRVTVMESAVKNTSTTLTVTATDRDSGIGGQVYYGLEAKGQNADDYKYTFYVEARTGQIFQNESLDYETRTFYQYNVKAW
ncbi:protocadherin gamma-A10-like, partial [Haliotis rubra]|uniref:protocadherin gamma-A10-like n=1 Tax=Haliotis rubra TaxID=36100 RepID=UPI001EE5804C